MCQYRYQKKDSVLPGCEPWKNVSRIYYSYNNTKRIFFGNDSCYDFSSYGDDSSITSRYTSLLNERYIYFMEHPDNKKLACKDRYIKFKHLSLLNSIHSQEKPQNENNTFLLPSHDRDLQSDVLSFVRVESVNIQLCAKLLKDDKWSNIQR